MKDTFPDGSRLAVSHNNRGSQLIESGDFEGASTCFMEALRHSPENPAILCNLGFTLMNLRNYAAAEKVCREALDIDPSYVIAARHCALVLEAQGKHAECVRFCLEMLDTFPGDAELHARIINPLYQTGNFEDAVDREEAMVGNAPEIRVSTGRAYGALGKHRQALEVFNPIVKGNPEWVTMVLSFIRSIAKCGDFDDMDAAYRHFEETLGSSKYKVWAHYQFARFYPCGDIMGIFDDELEMPLTPPPGPYSSTTAGSSRLVYGRGEMEAATETFAFPRVSRQRLAAGIAGFMELAGEIVSEGHFDLLGENLEAFRRRFGDGAGDPVFVLSTGRCGTLGLHEFLKKSEHVIPFHTLHCQLPPMDRNHLLYRIIEGNLDKDALTRILRTYVETRSAEILLACRYGKTPVIVNHWDTVFAPFNAVFSPAALFSTSTGTRPRSSSHSTVRASGITTNSSISAMTLPSPMDGSSTSKTRAWRSSKRSPGTCSSPASSSTPSPKPWRTAALSPSEARIFLPEAGSTSTSSEASFPSTTLGTRISARATPPR